MTRTTRRSVLLGTAGALAAPALIRAQGTQPIRIGEINSYTALPAFTLPYRNGWQLRVEEINAAGGVLGRPLEVVWRDDAGRPQDAVRLAGELLDNERVDLIAGTFFSHVGLAVADFAAQRRRLFVASEPLTDQLVWEKGNAYTFRLRPSTYMQAAMLVEEAAKLPAKRWVTVSPNYEYGQSAVKWFKQLLSAKRPDVEFVAEQWPALGRIDAGATVTALAQARPEAIYNVTFGPDLTNFVRQGNTRGLFERRSVVSLLTGEPEYLDPLADETPEGWIVTGYPWDQVNTPEHVAFRTAYQRRFNDYPRLGTVVGYDTITAIAECIKRAGSTETERMVAAMRDLPFGSPFGRCVFRGIDHQSTLGAFVGKTALRNNKGTMVDWRYADGANYLPPDDEVRRMRPQAA
ncbi:ABC transporter substrate-binding protein [Elioraea tepidiphila]|jgi:branched-chain amino acid transport system substrate-binding protein|uniref:ABC transporter substrate-binding protein n=1 Tax=Elioraea tepidiphila TaxID=457934 RepID=UPI00037A4E2B|nr:ABC transporter substrate-binding protein [Elioraea tepidiphila]